MTQRRTTIEGLNTHGQTEEAVVAIKEARARRSTEPKEVFGTRFNMERLRPIHAFGTPVDRTDAMTAIKLAGINFYVQKVKPEIKLDGRIIDHDTFSLVKTDPDGPDDGGTHLGYVGPTYRPIQNSDIARLLDESGLTAAWPVTCAGATDDGAKMFLELDAGVSYVKDEPVLGTVLITEGKDGGQGLRGQLVYYRQVCMNGLTAPVKASGINFFITHQGDIEGALELQTDVMARLRASQEQLLRKFQRMAETPVTLKQARRIVEAAWPRYEHPSVSVIKDLGEQFGQLSEEKQARLNRGKMRTESKDQRRQVRIDAAMEQYGRINDEFTSIAATAWSAWQAVTVTADWREGSALENTDESTVFGKRRDEKVRAFEEAMLIVNSKK